MKIRAPWGESLSLNNEVNICVSVSFVPLQIIMRTLFRLIICTFCYDISFKYWIFTQPHVVFPPQFFGFYGVPMRSYVCEILGLYHVLMYVCRVHRFVLPQFFCLYWLPMYVDPAVFFVLRSYIYKILYVLMYLDYWFLFPTIFMFVVNSHVCEILRFFCLYWIPT
jgi:hypothetical protein